MIRRSCRATAVVVLFAAAAAAAAGPRATPSAPAVALELFTSQGCSSCPPAEDLLRRLAADPELAGRIVPLALHVDYWDRLGWRDPYSSPRFSARQSSYARALGTASVYTPQLVVDGTAECVGSDEREARRLIAEAAARPARATVAIAAVEPAGDTLRVTLVVQPQNGPLERPAEVLVALTESGASTEVARGENARRRLRDDFAVRRLDAAFPLPAGIAGPVQRTVTVARPEIADGGRLSVAALVEDPVSLEILAATRRDL